MCVTLLAASLVVTAAGTVASIDNANYQAGMMELQLAEQREQLNQQREMERIAAMEAEALRLQDFRNQRNANLLALAASGTGQHMSFLQGIAPAEERALRTDLANIRLGRLGAENRIANQIRVNRTQGLINQAERGAAVTGAILNGVGSALGAASFYNQNRAPSAPKASRKGTVTVDGPKWGEPGHVWKIPSGGGPMPLG